MDREGTPKTRSPFAKLRDFANLAKRGSLSPRKKAAPNQDQVTPVKPGKENNVTDNNLEKDSNEDEMQAENRCDVTDEALSIHTTMASLKPLATLTENIKDRDEKILTPSRYSAIANLDDELENEKWSERTSVITKVDHDNYISSARDIVSDVIQEVIENNKGKLLHRNIFHSYITIFCP